MSNIIKQEEVKGYDSPLVFDFADVESRAEGVLAAAETRAASITAEAGKAAERLREEAGREGYAEGYRKGVEEGHQAGMESGRAEGLEESRAELKALKEAFEGVLGDFSAMKDDLFIKAEEDLLRLSLLIAQKVIAREIEADKHVTVDNLKRCLGVLAGRSNVVIRVAPAVLETVESVLPDLVRACGGMSSVRLEGDGEVSPGGCLITAGQGSLDATVETQLAEVETILFGAGDE